VHFTPFPPFPTFRF
jgi:hypothetical protein